MKKFVGIVLGTFLVSSFFTVKAHAFTLDDLMSQVASLRAEVAQLKSNLTASVIGSMDTKSANTSDQASVKTETTNSYAPTTTTPPIVILGSNQSSDVVLVKDLSYGQKQSVDVLNLQTYLKTKGLLTANPNGSFGPATLTAVKALQKANDLPVTGVVDMKTREVINNDKSNVYITKAVLTVDIDTYIKNIPSQIAILQSILKDPTKFKADVLALTPKTNGPIDSSGRVAPVQGAWYFSGSFVPDPGWTCGNSYVPASNEIVVTSSNGICLIYQWRLPYVS